MKDEKNIIKLVVNEDGSLHLQPDIDLSDYGINIGDKCIITIDDETNKCKIQKILDALIEEIELHDGELMNTIIEESPELLLKILSSSIPKSGVTIINLLVSMNSLKLGIFELCKSRDLYSLNVLYRSFLEHFIKINYFCHRLMIEKNDEVGNEYDKFYSVNEKVMYGKSIEELTKIIAFEYQGKTFEQIIREISPELKEYSNKEIREKILQFNYKNMIKYIVDNHNNNNLDKIANIMLSIIPEYSELSSFVHGGPHAIKNTAKIWDNNNIELVCAEYSRTTYNFNAICNMLSIVLFMNFIDKDYSSFHKKVQTIWNESGDKIDKYFEHFN